MYSWADASLLPELKGLWQLSFGDDDAFLRDFFTRFPVERTAVSIEDGSVLSMLYWFPRTLVLQASRLPAAYLYAVCTHPDARGRGLCRRLMAWAEEALSQQGVKAFLLQPGSPSLFDFYGTMGYSPIGTVDRLTVSGGAVTHWSPVAPEVYLDLRRALAPAAYTDMPLAQIAYQKALCLQSGGDLYRIQAEDGSIACGAAVLEAGQLLLKECLPGPVGPPADGPGTLTLLCPGNGTAVTMAKTCISAKSTMLPHFPGFSFG